MYCKKVGILLFLLAGVYFIHAQDKKEKEKKWDVSNPPYGDHTKKFLLL
jgi:hypothetical protein